MIYNNRRRGKSALPGLLILLVIIAGICLSVFSFWFYFSTKPLKSSDLTEIDGSLQKTVIYSGKGASYALWVNGYPCSFSVGSVFITQKLWNNFVDNTTSQTPVRLFIRKSDENKLDTDASIDLYQLYTGSKTIISLTKHNEAALDNARLALVLGFVFFALTAFLIFIFAKLFL